MGHGHSECVAHLRLYYKVVKLRKFSFIVHVAPRSARSLPSSLLCSDDRELWPYTLSQSMRIARPSSCVCVQRRTSAHYGSQRRVISKHVCWEKSMINELDANRRNHKHHHRHCCWTWFGVWFKMGVVGYFVKGNFLLKMVNYCLSARALKGFVSQSVSFYPIL